MIVATASITCRGTSFTVEQLLALRRASGGFVAKRKQWLLDGDTRADDLIQDTFLRGWLVARRAAATRARRSAQVVRPRLGRTRERYSQGPRRAPSRGACVRAYRVPFHLGEGRAL